MAAHPDEESKQRLITVSKDQTAVLVAGAGTSALLGYPMWDEPLIELAEEFAPRLGPGYDR